ncbi:MAG: hypothetical protein DCE90_18860 [Pseudanabaena sp.]|nr:MAG: hypothetical protein DCE90_18860 [Pseudanabaena sp.]
MKIDFLQEPELEFGDHGRHIDIRYGLMDYRPLDYSSKTVPRDIKIGIIGTSETIEGVEEWIEMCRQGLPAKPSGKTNFYPEFPGFGSETCLPSTLITETTLNRTILNQTLKELEGINNINELIKQAVNIFYEEIQTLTEKIKPDVVICALPEILLDLMKMKIVPDSDETLEEQSDGMRIDFRALLKARVMKLRQPTQIILPSTYDMTKKRRRKKRNSEIETNQDDATRAWNFYVALYYKAQGSPWRLVRDPRDLSTCFVGISFYKALDKSTIQTSIAQIFNERGEGIILQGGEAKISKDDKAPYLQEADAAKLLDDCLVNYRKEHQTFPARVVLHKTSRFKTEEIIGFQEALKQNRIDSWDFISFDDKSSTRLFRYDYYPPLRGTMLSLDEKVHIIYTRGSVNFFSQYSGKYIPRPLRFRCDQIQETPKQIAKEILCLTKMNWNNTQFDRRDPITIRAARQVGEVLKYLNKDETYEPYYRFYM